MNTALFIESIKVFQKKICNLTYHQQRFEKTRSQFFKNVEKIDLMDVLRIPEALGDGLYKCRLLYGDEIVEVRFEPYLKKAIQSLQMVEDDLITYSFKFEDRSAIQKLTKHKGNCDDILIVKKGLVTDTSYANIAFFDGKQWWTPHRPLLEGTQRQKLLDQKIITEKEIFPAMIAGFKKCRIFNAMMEWKGAADIEISEIFPAKS